MLSSKVLSIMLMVMLNEIVPCSTSLRVQVPNYLVRGVWVIVTVVQVLGKHMIVGYLDPKGLASTMDGVPQQEFPT